MLAHGHREINLHMQYDSFFFLFSRGFSCLLSCMLGQFVTWSATWSDWIGHRWYLRKNNVDEPIDEVNYNHDIRIVHHPQQHLSKIGQLKRIFVRDGGTLNINDIKRSDSGVYICIATNSEGSESLEIQLTVIEALTAQIQPAQQTVDLGKSADLVSTSCISNLHATWPCRWGINSDSTKSDFFPSRYEQRCIATGYPLASIWWLKDGQPLRTGSRVRLLTKEHIKITSVTKEDRGMYQCFVRNDYDVVQSTAEMRLGGENMLHNFLLPK